MPEVTALPSLSLTEIVAMITPLLAVIIIICQLVDRRDKKNQDLTAPMAALQKFITEEFHKGEIVMNDLKNDVRANRRDIERLEVASAEARKESGKVLEGLTGALKANTHRKRKADESDDGL